MNKFSMSREDIIPLFWFVGFKDFDKFFCRFDAIIMEKVWGN